MTVRDQNIADFLAAAGWADATRTPLAGDASARRYERLEQQTRRAVLMDAPPASGESTLAFLRMARWLRNGGFSAPDVLAADTGHGFLLLEDLGDALFAKRLAHEPKHEKGLYSAATDLLLALHECPAPDFIAPLDGPALGALVELTIEWYLPGIGGSGTPLALSLPGLVASEYDRSHFLPPVVALRDFHAENLIWLPDRLGVARVGLLDFQDAVLADPAYDLVSLLQDARRDVAPETGVAMIRRYCAARSLDTTRFGAVVALLGAQRALRILGVFARLCMKAGKPHYLGYMPRVWGYLERSLTHPELAELSHAVAECLPPPTAERLEGMREQCGRIQTR